MTKPQYLGIRFPDRAEAISEFAGYRVFLDPWRPLAEELRRYYEALALRRESRVLAIHGPQGAGKTMFATKLIEDFNRSKTDPEPASSNNLWHRVTGVSELDQELVDHATSSSDMLLIENSSNWVEITSEWLKHRTDRRCIVVADNAERSYFRQGLVSMSDAEFVTLRRDPELRGWPPKNS